MLRACKNIRIEFNSTCPEGKSHPEIQAVYLQAWLAAQLGWKFLQSYENQNLIRYKYEQCFIMVELIPKHFPAEVPGGIHSIEINTQKENIIISEPWGQLSMLLLRTGVKCPFIFLCRILSKVYT